MTFDTRRGNPAPWLVRPAESWKLLDEPVEATLWIAEVGLETVVRADMTRGDGDRGEATCLRGVVRWSDPRVPLGSASYGNLTSPLPCEVAAVRDDLGSAICDSDTALD